MYGNYYGREDIGFTLKVFICIGFVIAILIAIPCYKSYYSPKTYTATVTDKNIKNYSSSSKFLVFTKTNGETRVFSMEDTIMYGRWNTADDYAEIEVGETYTFKVIGWRIPFISEFENIVDFQKVTD